MRAAGERGIHTACIFYGFTISHSCIFSASNYTLIGDGSVCEQLERGGYTQPVYSTALQYLTLVFAIVLLISEVRTSDRTYCRFMCFHDLQHDKDYKNLSLE